MSSRPQRQIPPVPDGTTPVSPADIPPGDRSAMAVFPCGNPYPLLHDPLGAAFDDAGRVDFHPAPGRPAHAPWRLALVTLMQSREGPSDRRAVEAVRDRVDREHPLALDPSDPGFDHEVSRESWGRSPGADAVERPLARAPDAACGSGVFGARERRWTGGTRVLAAARTLERLELAGEALRAALDALAAVAPGWPRGDGPRGRTVASDWHDRHDRRVEELRSPEGAAGREAYAAQVGADGYVLLDALDRPDAPAGSSALPAVAALRRVWARHFERGAPDVGGMGDGPPGVRLRAWCTPDAAARTEASHGPGAESRTTDA